jgi:hypothetical protein
MQHNVRVKGCGIQGQGHTANAEPTFVEAQLTISRAGIMFPSTHTQNPALTIGVEIGF